MVNNSVADLEVCDPLNDGNVMTKNCYKFEEIKDLLRNIYKKCFEVVESQIGELYNKNKSLGEKELEEIITEQVG